VIDSSNSGCWECGTGKKKPKKQASTLKFWYKNCKKIHKNFKLKTLIIKNILNLLYCALKGDPECFSFSNQPLNGSCPAGSYSNEY